MNKILIATHGKFAEGIVSSAEIILGNQDNLFFINAYVDDLTLDQKFEQFFVEHITEGDTLIIFTDIYGGSVNQAAAKYLQSKEINIISGLNLPLLLEVIMLADSIITPEKLKEVTADAKEQIIYVNDQLLQVDEADDFDC